MNPHAKRNRYRGLLKIIRQLAPGADVGADGLRARLPEPYQGVSDVSLVLALNAYREENGRAPIAGTLAVKRPARRHDQLNATRDMFGVVTLAKGRVRITLTAEEVPAIAAFLNETTTRGGSA